MESERKPVSGKDVKTIGEGLRKKHKERLDSLISSMKLSSGNERNTYI